MRIIGGTYKGRKLHPPSGLPVRPTTDIAKESLFNILWTFLEFNELNVLDLFAGTGNISLEFASRECKQVISVDINPKCISFILSTAGNLKMNNIRAYKEDSFRFLFRNKLRFDLIFADPPYDMKGIPELPDMAIENALKPGGWLIIEHGDVQDFSKHPCFHHKRNYGKVNFSFFQKGIDQ